MRVEQKAPCGLRPAAGRSLTSTLQGTRRRSTERQNNSQPPTPSPTLFLGVAANVPSFAATRKSIAEPQDNAPASVAKWRRSEILGCGRSNILLLLTPILKT